ncbi:MAG: VWA domain-containing protein [Acidobacteriota bacterium]
MKLLVSHPIFVAALATVLLLGVTARESRAQSDVVSETIEVRVVNIDVVVTDRKGHRVSGLKQGDFELFEGKKQQEISNFSEVRIESDYSPRLPEALDAAPASTPPPGRRFIIFVDNSSIHPFSRNRVIASLRKFIDSELQPQDQVMLATWNHGLQIRNRFSADRAALSSALGEIAGMNGGAAALHSMRADAERELQSIVEQVREKTMSASDGYATALSVARAYGARLAGDEKNMVSGLQALMSTVAGRPEKKVLVFVGKSLPVNPGAELFQYIDEQFGSLLPPGTSSITTRMENNQSKLQESLVRSANAQGLTLYMVYADTGNSAGVESASAPSALVEGLELSNNFTSFQRVAQMTGGLAFGNSNSFDSAFAEIAEDAGSYYSLGYHSDLAEGARGVRVTVRTPGLRVRSRDSFVTRSFDEQMADRVVANLFSDVGDKQIMVKVSVGEPVPQSRGVVRIPIEVRIPADGFTLLPGPEGLAGGFAVYFAVADEDGSISAVTKQGRRLRLPGTDPEVLKGKYYTFSTELLVKKKDSILSVAVVDLVSHETGYDRSHVTLN